MPLATGTHLGPYEILGALGAGGMGEVYRARDTRLDRDVALKILPGIFGGDDDRLKRFEREAKTLASLNHPHIAQILGVEGTGHARAIVMELVEGPTLADRLLAGPFEMDDALAIAGQIADALEAAHDAGIVHRDLKPANIKVRADGVVKVLDFGLAKDTARDDDLAARTFTSPAMTAAGVILGTAAYMSPEQARGKPVDKRADIWAFGCVLYEMLTGRAPFPGDTITDVIASVVKNDPDWTALPAHTPPRIRRLIKRCLQKDPRLRLRDIGDARLDIVEPETIESARPPARRRPVMLMAALGTAAALAIGVAAGAWWKSSGATAAEEWNATRLGGPSIAMQPVLSPDGQLLAFQTIVDGQSQIAVMKPGGGTWRVLTSDRSRGLIAMHDWSPDGSRIFYDRSTDTLNGIFAVPALGGDERQVLESAGYPAALPDGDLLVQRVNANRQLQLHRFSPSTGRVEPLPALPESNGSDDSVVASRDGRRVYFFGRPLTDAPSATGVFELDLQSKQTRPVADTMNLRSPVSMSSQPGTDAIFIGGVDGDAFRIVRFSAATAHEARTVLLLPGAARFDIGADGAMYLGLRTRPVELFAFRAGAPATVQPERVSGLSLAQANTVQIIAPLPDGSVLIGSHEGDRDRMLVVKAGRQPVVLVEGDEETRPPATSVGERLAAIMIGSLSSPDIAIVNTADGRIVRRFKAPSPAMTGMAASPDGRVLYYTDAGSVWAIPAVGGEPRKVGAGDSMTVEPETGDLIVKLDEGERMRLVRMNSATGVTAPIALRGELRLIPRPLMPGAVRQGRLVVGLASTDSWLWHAGAIDLKTGVVSKLVEQNPSDFHYLTWGADGGVIGFGFGLDTSLWRFTPRFTSR